MDNLGGKRLDYLHQFRGPLVWSHPVPLSHRTNKTVVKGREYPLGATVVEGGVNFALYSRNASAVFLLLFDEPSSEPTDVIQLQDRDKFIWHGEVRGLKAGQLYGF